MLTLSPPTHQPDFRDDTPLLQLAAAVWPSGAVLRCVGEIDVSNVDRLAVALAALIEAGYSPVEVDLREVVYLDGAAIRALLRARHLCGFSGRTLTVRAHPRALRLFLLLKLDRVFNVRCD